MMGTIEKGDLVVRYDPAAMDERVALGWELKKNLMRIAVALCAFLLMIGGIVLITVLFGDRANEQVLLGTSRGMFIGALLKIAYGVCVAAYSLAVLILCVEVPSRLDNKIVPRKGRFFMRAVIYIGNVEAGWFGDDLLIKVYDKKGRKASEGGLKKLLSGIYSDVEVTDRSGTGRVRIYVDMSGEDVKVLLTERGGTDAQADPFGLISEDKEPFDFGHVD